MTAAPMTGQATRAPTLCAQCAVRHSAICSALTAEELAGLNRISQRKTLKRGQIYVLEGDAAREYANVVAGVGKLTRGAPDGRTQVVGLLFASDFVGTYRSSEDEGTEPYTIEAATDLDICSFPRRKFALLAQEHPGLEAKILARTVDELQLARDWMVLLGRKTAPERVATFLLYVADKMENQGCGSIKGSFDLPISRADIADHIGLTIETVSRQMTEFRKSGAIEVAGARHIVGYDRQALEDMAGF
ncbi:MAG: Crp/Fnr family transcriptional regulator [Pseudomonadota bacterium]